MNCINGIDELVKRIKMLKPGSELFFHDSTEDSDIYGVSVIEKHETYLLLINSIGGGNAFVAEIGANHFPIEAEQELLIYLDGLELNDYIIDERTKTFFFGQYWQVYGTNSMEVPIHFTTEQAKAYVKENWANVGLAPSGDYVSDSDEPDFDNCDFSEEHQ